MKRRTFFKTGGALIGAAAAAEPARRAPVDFRYAPPARQATFCFPDDPHKSLIGEDGDLRYGFDRNRKISHFPYVVRFLLRGTEQGRVTSQRLEAPGTPVVHTRLEYSAAILELTTFATNRAGEGRVDNVIAEVRPKSDRGLWACAAVQVKTRRTMVLSNAGAIAVIHPERDSDPPFMIADRALRATDSGDGYLYSAPDAQASANRPMRCFFRFPLEGQSAASLQAGLREPDALLAGARSWWEKWKPFQGTVDWQLPSVYQNFLLACTRNILQARERLDGKATFQVGPTVYRGLWVVDGNFLLEAARYLGYDLEVQQGLEATWSKQRPDGSVVAAVTTGHWKDTAIAMYSMVRQAELSQDWSYFRKMRPDLLRAADFLHGLRDQARKEGSAVGRYGLLARGFGDGGIGGGLREELTNTIWTLAGLRAVCDAAGRLGIDGFDRACAFRRQLADSFFACARREMRRHPPGFEYLPMLIREDPGWQHADERQRPRPQSGQWALAHGIYPGLVFDKQDPVVKGYVALMNAVTQEDVPAETGWIPHEGLWTYDAAFAAHVYLWAGLRDRAMSTFTGFLNHASPLYCWREEQPLAKSLIGSYVGDMPHNWASAECVLFLRHMLALEDGPDLRLLAGIGREELSYREPYKVVHSPTRFGRVGIRLEPAGRDSWRLGFDRGSGPTPKRVTIPELLGGFRFAGVQGAKFAREPGAITVDPAALAWTATWRVA
jgi:hypothetical protein